MDSIGLPELAEILGGQLRCVDPAGKHIRHASIHSDHVRGGSAFFALRGTHTDGHKYVDRALRNGAVVAVVAAREVEQLRLAARETEKLRLAAREAGQLREDLEPLVVVESPLQSLRALATWWRSRLSTTFVAVVGNVGKTVTKDSLVHFLGYEWPVYGSPGSYNSQIGVPLSILECPRDAKLAVIEAAATERGEMSRHASLIRPTYVVLTNIGTRWESNFDGTAEQAREMVAIAAGLPESGWLIIGDPDPALLRAAEPLRVSKHVMGQSEGLPVFSAPDYGIATMNTFVVFPDGIQGPLTLRTPSEHMAADVQLGVSAAWLLGVPSSTLLEALRDYTPTLARMEVWRSPTGVTVVRDIATTNGATFAGAARVAKRLTKAGGRTVVVLADSYDGCGDDTASALGQTIGRAGFAELCALDLPLHSAIVSSARAVGQDLDARQFGSQQKMREHLTSSLRSDDVALIQAPRDRTISELSLHLVEPMASTRLYIDQSAIESNILSFRRLIGPGVQLMAMVKALAYGTNPVQISVCLEAAGVDALAVATVDEGAALRRAGISLDTILVVLATEDEMELMAQNRLTPLIYSPHMLAAARRYAEQHRRPLRVHLEVDSGMHRTGLCPEDAIGALRSLRELPTIKVAGLMTHFACADMAEKDDFTLQQLSIFEDVVGTARELGFNDITRHAANTAATIRLPSSHLDMVRIGIGLFGVHPSPETSLHTRLTPAVSLIGKIVEVHELTQGEAVGYGATFRASPGGARIGVVAAGYHDCIPRAFSNFGSVMVNGQHCPIVGTVSMDSMTIDITRCRDAIVGSDVTIYGRHGASFVPIEDVARKIGTIPYELLTRIGPRVQRVFTRH